MTTAPNVRAIHLYGGSIGTFLESEEATPFDHQDHSWPILVRAGEWLQANNPLIRALCPRLAIPLRERVAVGGLPFAGLI